MSEIRKIGVVGAGAMGTGIALVAAQSGYDVLLRDIEQGRLDSSLRNMDQILQRSVAKGRLTDEDRRATLARVETTTDLDGFAGVDFVIEAIFEDPEAKRAIFRELDRICRPEVILASNTSSISITDLGAATSRPSRVCGMHFFNPVPVMKLVEVIRGYSTSSETVATARAVAEAMGKTVVEVKKDSPGFIVNRILMPLLIEAVRVVEEGIASPEDVDKAVKLGLNHPMGPLELIDFTGIDVCHNVMQYFWQEFNQPQYAPPQLLRTLVRAGRLGRKTGKGFYDYEGK
ncbi:3-hydroxyacyl-CoA dehydrogenase family protein [Caldinitratiruptor microaerophilus]|uniref:3-hydroxybutyryl-CoA dehydrogenase n=1 Tax=Caldinitratiruptor microaerophilus TaxID=671077 RepID=A0AA35CM85_9FIRM|nr:3-hydroxybutyryl-CoA dehydrogenase [Caldinitratiruptor microaerophilus]BDG61059.1 3-hydroxybutyryl-CoA dehydrogenase [Caldinitratiruptor microaerophilus]